MVEPQRKVSRSSYTPRLWLRETKKTTSIPRPCSSWSSPRFRMPLLDHSASLYHYGADPHRSLSEPRRSIASGWISHYTQILAPRLSEGPLLFRLCSRRRIKPDTCCQS